MSNDNQSGAAPSAQKSHAELIAGMRKFTEERLMLLDAMRRVGNFADDLESAHKREITILRDALAEVVASIEVRFPAIEYALDRKPYLDAKKILEQYKEEAK